MLGRDYPPVVLLLSTYDEDAGKHFVAESGAAAYMTKSAFGPDLLEECVVRCWSVIRHRASVEDSSVRSHRRGRPDLDDGVPVFVDDRH